MSVIWLSSVTMLPYLLTKSIQHCIMVRNMTVASALSVYASVLIFASTSSTFRSLQ